MLRALVTFLVILVILAALGAGGAMYIFQKYGRGLPDYRQLADYEPPPLDDAIDEELSDFIARRKSEMPDAAY